MAKHDCGSCRFFDQASDGKHGWCTHPERRESTSVRILVRAAELRCRNDWGQDQWQTRTVSDQVLDVVMTDQPGAAPTRVERPLPPLDRPSYDPPSTVYLSSAPLVPTAGESDPDEPSRRVSDDLNRELLRGAHARYRERQKNKSSSTIPDRKPEPEPLIISNKYIPPSGETGHRATRGVTSSVFEFNASKTERTFDDVPEVTGSEQSRPQSNQERLAEHSTQLAAQSSSSELPAPASDWTTEELFVDDAVEEIRVEQPRTPLRPEIDAAAALGSEPLPRESSRPSHAPLRAADLETWEANDSEYSGESRAPWAEIPRCCQTCRDFRPAGNGQRGWCNNQWAFRHRRMVDAQDIPCETSVGNWWIPGDEAWQGEFDVSVLGQPTPLMDKWFGRRGGNEESADGTGDRHRRRTGSW